MNPKKQKRYPLRPDEVRVIRAALRSYCIAAEAEVLSYSPKTPANRNKRNYWVRAMVDAGLVLRRFD